MKKHLFIMFFFVFSHQSFCRDIFIKSGYKTKQTYRIDECYLSVFSEVFDEHQRLYKEEEGVISLKNNIDWQYQDYAYAFVLDAKSLERKKTSLFFETKEDRYAFISNIRSLQHTCQKDKKAKREQPLLFSQKGIPTSFDFSSRPVHRENVLGSLLTNGKEAWIGRSIINKLASKNHDSILLQTLIFMADEAGLHWSHDLIKRRKAGVQVEIFLDSLSSFLDLRDLTVRKNTTAMYQNMMAAGIPVYGFRCGYHHHLVDEAFLSQKFKKHIYNQRYHEKMWIVNDDYAILGGLNVGNDYFRLNRKGADYWRDQDVLIKHKETIHDLKSIFQGNVSTYIKNYQNPKSDFCFNPHDPVLNRLEYEKFLKSYSLKYRSKRTRKHKKEKKSHALSVIQKYQKLESSHHIDWSNIRESRIVHNRPKVHELHIEDMYLDLMNQAKKEIIISNAYFVPSLSIQKAIKSATKRGVQVFILTNSYETNDIPPISVLSRNGYLDLVKNDYSNFEKDEHHIHIHEWTGKKKFHINQVQGTNHAKFLVVDKKFVFIGSYNLDPRSRDINSEIGIAFSSSKIGKNLSKHFFDEDLKFAREIPYRDMMKWKKHIPILKTSWLKMKGGYQEFNLLDIGKQRFFEHLAHRYPHTW